MARFVSFNGDSVWWNTDLFHTIGIGFGKYGIGDVSKYTDKSQRDILGFRNKREGGVVDNETIVLYSGKSQHQCEKVIEAYTNAIKNTDDIPDRMWLEAEHESYDPNLFHKIESVRFEPYDGHNSVAWTEYNVWGRYIDPKKAEWTDEDSKYEGWWGSELLCTSQIYGECEKATKASQHLITLD